MNANPQPSTPMLKTVAKRPSKPVGESQPVRPSRVAQAEFDRVERDLKRLRAEQADLFKRGLLDADGHPSTLAVRKMLLRIMREKMRPPENGVLPARSPVGVSMRAKESQREKFQK